MNKQKGQIGKTHRKEEKDMVRTEAVIHLKCLHQ